MMSPQQYLESIGETGELVELFSDLGRELARGMLASASRIAAEKQRVEREDVDFPEVLAIIKERFPEEYEITATELLTRCLAVAAWRAERDSGSPSTVPPDFLVAQHLREAFDTAYERARRQGRYANYGEVVECFSVSYPDIFHALRTAENGIDPELIDRAVRLMGIDNPAVSAAIAGALREAVK